MPLSASLTSLKHAVPFKKSGKTATVGMPLRPNHNKKMIPRGVKKINKRLESNVAVNQSTSLNRTTETFTDLESERGSLKYVSANLETAKLQT